MALPDAMALLYRVVCLVPPSLRRVIALGVETNQARYYAHEVGKAISFLHRHKFVHAGAFLAHTAAAVRWPTTAEVGSNGCAGEGVCVWVGGCGQT